MERITQKETAKGLGISESYLSKILSGKSTPRPVVMKKLTNMTNSNADIWLFGDRDQKEKAIKESLFSYNLQSSPVES